MNERVHKLLVSSMALLTGLLLLFPVCAWDVNAEVSAAYLDENNPTDLTNISDILWQMPSNGVLDMTGYWNNSTYNYIRLRYNSVNSTSVITPESPPNDLFLLSFKLTNNNNLSLLAYRTGFPAGNTNHSMSEVFLYLDGSTDGVTWSRITTFINGTSNNEFTGNSLNGYAFPVSYISTNNSNFLGLPNGTHINLKSGQSRETILQVLSYRLTSRPWGNWSNSSGGLVFENGLSLNATDRSRYEQIFIVMDVNHDNSVSQEEVNYYNVTYNTNYDYSEINEGNNFTELDFLGYIALLLSQGVENPGGGTGEGGGSGSNGSAGIYVGDGSFTQSQTQTIEENAVNVTVNNNNSLSQENVQTLENFIENNLGSGTENAFGEAVGGINRFIGVGQAFASLATAVLGFLPDWTVTLLGVLFTIIFVLIVFRLLHLFL